MADIRDEWMKITGNVPEQVRQKWWEDISVKYNESHRNAHNFEYLKSKLDILKDIKNELSNPDAFALALFFQYLNYDTKDSDVGLKNIAEFERFAMEAGINGISNPNFHASVKCLLEESLTYCTEEHKNEGVYGQEDIHYFLDLDVTWLGKSPEEYRQYLDKVAEEYSYLDDATYKKLRRRVLQSFLLIPNIFATKLFRDKYEAAARTNIQEELKMLSA